MSTANSTISINVGRFIAILVASVTAVVFTIFIWIFVYHVLKDREAAKKKQKQEMGAGGEANGSEKTDAGDEEKKIGGLFELEQPSLPELDGTVFAELWSEGWMKEVDGRPVVFEMGVATPPAAPASRRVSVSVTVTVSEKA